MNHQTERDVFPLKPLRVFRETVLSSKIASRKVANFCFLSSGIDKVSRAVSTKCPKKTSRWVGKATDFLVLMKYRSSVSTAIARTTPASVAW